MSHHTQGAPADYAKAVQLLQVWEDTKAREEACWRHGNGGKRKVPYTLVAGNTSIIESSAGEDETVYKQVITGLKERGKYILADFALFDNDINDMAVRINSMKDVPGGFVEIKEIACDHLSYYAHTVVPPILVPMP